MAQKRTRTANYTDECSSSSSKKKQKTGGGEDGFIPDKFINFCELCTKIGDESGYNAKTALVKEFIAANSSQGEYGGDLYLLVKLLLPHVQRRIYNLKDKQLVKLFSQIFQCDASTMTSHLERSGSVSDTVTKFFMGNSTLQPKNQSQLSLQEVDVLLDGLAAVTKEEDQLKSLTKIVQRCTVLELTFIIRLIKHDLRMNAGTKHILDALDVNAYAAFQASSDLKDVVSKVVKNVGTESGVPGLKKKLSIRTAVMTPVKPMLAEACKSVDTAFKKCPSGIYAEIKYDGERVQVHKEGSEYKYYSRSLKAVQPHKVSEFKDLLPQACPHGDSLILDGEVLLVDNKTGKPLPFGTLGIHKKSAFKDASVCYFIFDILQLNEDNLMKKPLVQRRQILQRHISEVKHRVQLSEMNEIKDSKDLRSMLQRVFAENLEGLVLKDKEGVYEPGKRHWLKMKKDYLEEGAMADTADLVVLGAYYGTGNKGGLMSVFLMGCYDPGSKLWMTVTKCGNGHDDATLKRLQKELKMEKVNKMQPTTPSWLHINKTLMPDFFVKDPKEAPVWEITGAEFSKSTTHTAGGISIRFPRVTRIRDDKDWRTATDLVALKKLYEASKETSEIATSTDGSPNAGSSSPLPNKGKPRSSKPVKSKPRLGKASPGSKPACKYGANCYQKNAEHKEKYSHPEAVTEELQSVFKGLRFCFGDDLDQKDVKKLKRYIIAYDGEVVDKYHLERDTYLVTDKQESQLNSVKTVSTQWVWQSIRRGEPETSSASS